MPQRRRPAVLSTRVTASEKAMLREVAESQDKSPAELVWELVVPNVRDAWMRLQEGHGQKVAA